jgi:hypothetical protein
MDNTAGGAETVASLVPRRQPRARAWSGRCTMAESQRTAVVAAS